jgi:N-acetylglucosamine transport system substrate-binding protein
MGLVYNTTLLKENSWQVPITWDEFFSLGELAKAKDIALFTYQGIYPGYLESLLIPAIASSAGTEALGKITSFESDAFSSPEIQAVLENIKKIADEGYLLPNTLSLDHIQSQTQQMMNKALFIPNGTWVEQEMRDAPRTEGYEFGLATAPIMSANDQRYIMVSADLLFIPKSAKNPEAAKELIRLLYTDDSVKLYAEKASGYLAVNNAWSITQGLLPNNSMFSVLSDSGVTQLLIGFDPLPTDVVANDLIFKPVSDVMSGKMTVAEWTAKIDEAFKSIKS